MGIIETIVGFVVTGLYINSVAYIIGSIILGFFVAKIADLEPRDPIVALGILTVLFLYQFFFRVFDDLSPERIIGQYLYVCVFLAACFVASVFLESRYYKRITDYFRRLI